MLDKRHILPFQPHELFALIREQSLRQNNRESHKFGLPIDIRQGIAGMDQLDLSHVLLLIVNNFMSVDDRLRTNEHRAQ